jgi:hypothetical protein
LIQESHRQLLLSSDDNYIKERRPNGSQRVHTQNVVTRADARRRPYTHRPLPLTSDDNEQHLHRQAHPVTRRTNVTISRPRGGGSDADAHCRDFRLTTNQRPRRRPTDGNICCKSSVDQLQQFGSLRMLKQKPQPGRKRYIHASTRVLPPQRKARRRPKEAAPAIVLVPHRGKARRPELIQESHRPLLS